MHRPLSRYRDPAAVFAFALALRLLFAALTSNTYDPDEFVVLYLARALDHGAVAYRDFVFFHPPGILVIFRLLDPLTSLWWPVARVAGMVVDSLTAVVTWRIGLILYGRSQALAAGFLYAMSPVVLLTAVRAEQESWLTLLGMVGLLLLLTRDSRRASAVAGACLGAAIWIKLPAVLFLPVYALAAPRRFFWCMAGMVAALALLFAPYLSVAHSLYDHAVVWQLGRRTANDPLVRLQKVAVFWLLFNALAVVGVVYRRRPLWLVVGYLSGGIFAFTASVYYHYYLPIAPFASLLAAPAAIGVVRLTPRRLLVLGAAVALLWAVDIDFNGPGRFYVTATGFGDLRPVLQVVGQRTPPGSPILADRFEYAYLTGRPAVDYYFWNLNQTVEAQQLERSLKHTSAVVFTTRAGDDTYPRGFVSYIRARYPSVQPPGAIVWLLDRRTAFRGDGGAQSKHLRGG